MLNKRFTPHLALIVLGMLLYGHTLNAPFEFDDSFNIVENPAIRDFWHFISDDHAASSLPFNLAYLLKSRAAGYLTFAMNYRIGGLNVAGYHAVNIALHILSALLLFEIVRLALRTPALRGIPAGTHLPLAHIIATLFICHPIQTQAITYIVQRFTALAAFFCLSSLYSYALMRDREEPSGNKGRALLAASVLFSALAMKTKEIAFTMPLLIFLYELMLHTGTLRRRLPPLLPVLATMLIIPLTMLSFGTSTAETLQKIASTGPEQSNVTHTIYAITQILVLVTYLRLLVFPAGQNVDYDYPLVDTLLRPDVLGAAGLLAGLLGLGFWMYRRGRREPLLLLASYGVFWFFISTSVESWMVAIGDVIFEHRMYMPSAGVFMAAGAGGAHIIDKLRPRHPAINKAALGVTALIIIALGAATISRNSLWLSEVGLWEDAVSKSPNKARVYINLGVALDEIGDHRRAAGYLERAVEIDPENRLTHQYLGVTYSKLGIIEDAIKELNSAIAIDPTDEKIHYDLGWVYASAGMSEQAIEQYKESIRLRPSAKTYTNLGDVYTKQRMYNEAIAALANAISLDPTDSLAYNNLGNAHSYLKKHDLAIKSYRQALGLDPSFADARSNLITELIGMGEREAALRELSDLERINPGLAARVRASIAGPGESQ